MSLAPSGRPADAAMSEAEEACDQGPSFKKKAIAMAAAAPSASKGRRRKRDGRAKKSGLTGSSAGRG